MLSVSRAARWTRRVAVAIAAVVSIGGATQPAFGQRGMMGQLDIGATALSKRSLEDYAKILGLDDAQREAAAELLVGYREQHKVAREARDAKVEAMMEDARDTGDWMGIQKSMQEEALKFRDEFKRLEETLTADLKALLTEGQLAKWDVVERHRRRDLGLRFQFYTGAAVDLVQIAARSGTAPASPEFAELSTQYEVEMDRQMREWERIGKSAEDDMRKNPENAQMAMMTIMEEMGAVSKQVRDLNKDFANRMMGLMDEEQKAKFEDAFNERAYPRIYKKVHVREQLDAALALEDLDSSQKETVKALRDQWLKESRPLNAAWARAMVSSEDDSGGMFGSMMRRFGGDANNAKETDLKQARQDRKDLEDRVSKRLGEVLNEQQRAKLPKKRPGNMDPFADIWGAVNEDDDE